jgi:toxin ParE1/3/4
MKILWTDPAIDDLQAIRDYIARDSELYADDFILGILSAAERLESFPELGRATPEAGASIIREIIFGNYRIIYRLGSEMIQVLTVIHGSKDLSRLPSKPWEIQ